MPQQDVFMEKSMWFAILLPWNKGWWRDPEWCCFMDTVLLFLLIFYVLIFKCCFCELLWGGVFVFGICSFSAYELLFFFNSVHKFQAETGVVFFSTSEVALLHYCEAQDFNFFSQKQGATSSGAKRSESIEWGEEIRLWHGEQLSPSVWLSVCHKRKKKQ